MTEAEAAAYLGVKQISLYTARCAKVGPRCTVTWLDGRHSVAEYQKKDLEFWRQEHPGRATAGRKPRKKRADAGARRKPGPPRSAMSSRAVRWRQLHAEASQNVAAKLAALRAARLEDGHGE
jgi:hypothetical protein